MVPMNTTSPITSIDQFGANSIWSQMLAGNRRFATGKPEHAGQDVATRESLRAGQRPLAAVLSCSDSRVPPEIVFDMGLGDLFCVRTAGAVLGATVVESLEYAVETLGVKVIVVMSHENCGAVKAAMEGGHDADLPHIMGELDSAIDLAREAELDDPADVERILVAQTIERLVDSSEVIRRHVADDTVYIAGARYSMETGRVEVLSF